MKVGSKVKIKQTRSQAGRTERFRGTVAALGLGKIGSERVHVINAQMIGQLNAVRQIITVEAVK